MSCPPYTKPISTESRKALLDALNDIAAEIHGDTAVWATLDKTGKARFWYAPAGTKKSASAKDDFIEQFDSRGMGKDMASKIVKFAEEGCI